MVILLKILRSVFFSMSIESYEIFVKILTATKMVNGFELLMNYNWYRETTSLKTYLHNIEKEMNLDTQLFQRKILNSQKDYLEYISK